MASDVGGEVGLPEASGEPGDRVGEAFPESGSSDRAELTAEAPESRADAVAREAPGEPAIYALEKGRCLSTFLGEDPDFIGWNNFLELLAADCVLDPDSVWQDGHELKGKFTLPGSHMEVDFAISPDGYTVLTRDTALAGAVGEVDYRAAIAFQETDGDVSVAHASLQFHPREGQLFHDDGPIGYLYDTTDDTISYRAIGGHVGADGKYWVSIPPPDSAQTTDGGNVGAAFRWMLRLKEIERIQATSGR